MRPRKLDLDLPKNVYVRSGTYWLVKKGRWINLGKNRDHALFMLQTYLEPLASNEREIIDYIAKKVAVARGNAKGRRGIPFSLTKNDVLELVKAQKFRCAVTGVRFSLEKRGRFGDRPFAPSIDRVDSDQGYTPANCRIVCVATNFAINRWGDGILDVLLAGRRAVIGQSKTNLDKAA